MKTNYKIMKKSEITDEEILKHMDFDSLLAKNQSVAKKSINHKLKWAIAISILSIAVILYFTMESDKQLSYHVISTKDKEVNNLSKPIQDQRLMAQDSQQVQVKEQRPVVSEPTKKKITKAEPIDKPEIIMENVYLEAVPVLGYPHLYNYLNSNLQYPHEAIKDSIQGVESVSFIIGKDGQPTKIEILNTLGAPFDKEVLRLMEKMPAWKPATLNGQPVLSKVSVPFTFKMVTTNR